MVDSSVLLVLDILQLVLPLVSFVFTALQLRHVLKSFNRENKITRAFVLSVALALSANVLLCIDSILHVIYVYTGEKFHSINLRGR
jgi:hypothetical protein